MDPARPLHSVFAELTGGRGFAQESGLGPDEVLAAHGHRDLPESLVAEAVVNYADTAPVEVAEHLAPYVRANSAVPQPAEPAGGPEPHWYDLLTTAPSVTGLAAGHDVLDAEATALAGPDGPGGGARPADAEEIDTGAAGQAPAEFGHGHGARAEQPATELGDDAPPAWSASVTPSFETNGLDTGSEIDLRPLPADDPLPGDEPDEFDGA